MRVNQLDDTSFSMLEAGLLSGRAKTPRAVVVVQNELAPEMQSKCLKCSLLGLGLIILGSMNVAIVVTKGSFDQSQTPKLDAQFTALTAEYFGFASGLFSMVSGVVALRSAMTANDSTCFVKALAITALSTSILGLFVSDYFS
jgi:hypothetical protein